MWVYLGGFCLVPLIHYGILAAHAPGRALDLAITNSCTPLVISISNVPPSHHSFLLPVQASILSSGSSTSLRFTVNGSVTLPVFPTTPIVTQSPHCPPYLLRLCGFSLSPWPLIHIQLPSTSSFIAPSWQDQRGLAESTSVHCVCTSKAEHATGCG